MAMTAAGIRVWYLKRLVDGYTLHQQGRQQKDHGLMNESLKLLDEIKIKIEQ